MFKFKWKLKNKFKQKISGFLFVLGKRVLLLLGLLIVSAFITMPVTVFIFNAHYQKIISSEIEIVVILKVNYIGEDY
jgi:hypothetical protein